MASATDEGPQILTLYTEKDAPAESLRGSATSTRTAIACFELPEPHELEGAGAVLLRAPDLAVAQLDAALGESNAEVFIDTSGAWSHASAALLLALRRRRPGLTGCFGADPLRAFARGLPLDWDRAAELFAHDGFNVLRHSSAPYSDAGAPLVDQLAFLTATVIDTLRHLEERGVDPALAATRTTLQLELDCDQFLDIATLRAARACWARIGQVIGFDVPARLHAETARRVLTMYDPWVNLLRGTITTFAAIAGGADWVTAAPFDAVAGVPSEMALRLARNTALLLLEEAHLDHVIDPAGGSWYVERLTRDLAESSWRTVQEIESLGGMQAVSTSGWLDRRLDEARAAKKHAVAQRKDPITGVSEFPNLAERRLEKHRYRMPEGVQDLHLADLNAAVEAAAAPEPAGASLVSIAHGLAPRGPTRPALPYFRFAEDFEALRARSDTLEPRIFLASLGPLSEHTVRTAWAESFFGAGGVRAVSGEGDVIEAFKKSGARAAVICSSDRIYAEQAEPIARALRAAGAEPLYLAGKPSSAYPVDRFVFTGTDAVETIRALLRTLEERR